MKRYTAFIEYWSRAEFRMVEAVRVLGINRKTGKLWVKCSHSATKLVDRSELLP